MNGELMESNVWGSESESHCQVSSARKQSDFIRNSVVLEDSNKK